MEAEAREIGGNAPGVCRVLTYSRDVLGRYWQYSPAYDSPETAAEVMELYSQLKPYAEKLNRAERGAVLWKILDAGGLSLQHYARAVDGRARDVITRKARGKRPVAVLELAEAALLAKRARGLWNETNRRYRAARLSLHESRRKKRAKILKSIDFSRIIARQDLTSEARRRVLNALFVRTPLTFAAFAAVAGYSTDHFKRMRYGLRPISRRGLLRALAASDRVLWALRPLRRKAENRRLCTRD